jgi:hypothetical protein
MVGRLSIALATACFLSVVACADSISLQHNPNLATQRRALRATAKFLTASHAITGDLGRGFSAAERRSLLRIKSGEFLGDNVPRGRLVTAEPGQLNFDFLGSSARTPQAPNSFTDLVRALFQRKPHGARGRRELAEAEGR